jgi:hypothetical protein
LARALAILTEDFMLFLVIHSRYVSCSHLEYWLEMVTYTLEEWVFLYCTYEKNKSHKLCKKKFCCKYTGVRDPASLMIFKSVKKVQSTGSSQNAVLTKGKLDETVAR